MRVKRGVVRHAKHKKIIKSAKGYIGRKKSVFRLAKQATLKAGQFAYRDRKNKKRVLRSAWIVKINAALSEYGISYSSFIKKLSDKKIEIDRKIMASLIDSDPKSFKTIVEKVK
jgi:large subunit ribosomal protein L20